MARIRNVKPEFFSHEELQEMETEHPELHPMLVFSGLWTQCERSGVFLWSPKKLKLSILPFMDFDLETSLEYLKAHGFILKYARNGKSYGYVYNFTEYQAFSKNEKAQKLKYPLPAEEELFKDSRETVAEQSRDCSEDVTGEVSESEDIGHRTKDIDINSSGSAEREAAPPVVSETSSSKPEKPKKTPLREREPENDMERVEKAYLQNWDALYSQNRVQTPEPVVNWNQTRKLLKQHFEKVKPGQIIQAVNDGMKDDWIMSGGYSLAVMLSASVLNRLVNSGSAENPQSAKKRL